MLCSICFERDTKGNRICEECFVSSVTHLKTGERIEIDWSQNTTITKAEAKAREKAETEAEAEALHELGLEEVLELPVSMLGLKLPITNRLYTKKITTIRELLQRTQPELLRLGSIGKGYLRDILNSLKKFQALNELMRG